MWTPRPEDLLVPLADRGYPDAYLVARLKGRGGRLLSFWKSPPEQGGPDRLRTSEGRFTWASLGRELRWVYAAMNRELRGVFWPFFFAWEAGPLFACLRLRTKEGTETQVRAVLDASLLSGPIKATLLSENTLPAIVDTLEGYLSPFLPGGSLRMALDRSGLAAVEETFADAFHVFASGSRVQGPLRGYFSYHVDMRNILTAHKSIRWKSDGAFTYLQGGTLSGRLFRKALNGGGIQAIRGMAADLAGGITGEETDLAVLLLRGLLKRLRRSALVGSDNAYILWYLQALKMEARNTETVTHAGDMKAITIEKELVW